MNPGAPLDSTGHPMLVNNQNILLCPYCGKEFLRHTAVHDFSRFLEDLYAGLHTVCSETRTTIDTDLSGTPSPRKDGISIYFECEICGVTSILDIYQHKGHTYIQLRVQENQS